MTCERMEGGEYSSQTSALAELHDSLAQVTFEARWFLFRHQLLHEPMNFDLDARSGKSKHDQSKDGASRDIKIRNYLP